MKDSRLQKLRTAGWVVFGLVLSSSVAFGIVSLFSSGGAPQKHVVTTVTRVVLPPPPPPPPPPPKPPEPVKEDKPIEQPKVQEPKQEQARPKEPPKPAAPAAPPGNPLTAEAGSGANPYGLGVGNGGGDTIGGGGGGGGAGFAAYNSQLSELLHGLFSRDEKLKYAVFRAPMRVWLDARGQVTRAEVAASSGDPTIDAQLQSDALGGQLPPPPEGYKMPVTVRVQFTHR